MILYVYTCVFKHPTAGNVRHDYKHLDQAPQGFTAGGHQVPQRRPTNCVPMDGSNNIGL